MSSYDFSMNGYYGIGAVNGPPGYYALGQVTKDDINKTLQTVANIGLPLLNKDSKEAEVVKQVLVATQPNPPKQQSDMNWVWIIGGLAIAGGAAYYFMKRK